MSDFEVNVDQLRSHAGKVGELHGQTAEAVDAAHQVTPGGWDNAYGVICQSFPAALRPTAEQGIDALQKVSDGMEKHSGQLGQAADRYEDAERKAAQALEAILKKLEQLSGGSGPR